MCGIVYVKRKDKRPAYKAVLKRYRAQKFRGQQGFGYVAIKDGQIVNYKRAPTEHEIIQHMSRETADEILFHHRYPTSVPNIEEAAHPLLVENKALDHQYYVAHNGVIRNTEELKKKHEEMGMVYTTEIAKGFIALSSGKNYQMDVDWNDSESLAIETALVLDAKKNTIDTEGAAAVIGIKALGKKVVSRFFFRNHINPLHFNEDAIMITITSKDVGKSVTAIYVNELTPGGGFHELPAKIFVPKTYKEYTYPKRTWNAETKTWEEEERYPAHPTRNRTIPLALPGRQEPRVGFWPRDEVSYAEDSFGIPDWPLDSDRSRKVGDIMKNLDVLSGPSEEDDEEGIEALAHLSLAEVWSEYDKALGAEEDLKKEIAELDGIAEDMSLTDAALDKRAKLQIRLDDITDYIADLSTELTIRESQTVGPRSG